MPFFMSCPSIFFVGRLSLTFPNLKMSGKFFLLLKIYLPWRILVVSLAIIFNSLIVFFQVFEYR